MLAKLEYLWNQALIKQGKDPAKIPFKKTMIKTACFAAAAWVIVAVGVKYVVLPMEIPDGMYLQLSYMVRQYHDLKPEVYTAMGDGKITVEEYIKIQKKIRQVAPGKPGLEGALRGN